MRRIAAYALLLIAALVAYDLQPWRYAHAGYARADVTLPDGTLRFDLVDHAGKKARGYCLSYAFTTHDPAGESITLLLDRVGTRSQPVLRSHVETSGRTVGDPQADTVPRFFEAPNIGRLEFPFDEPLEVSGSVTYKGATHPFHAELQLKRWHRDQHFTAFCVG